MINIFDLKNSATTLKNVVNKIDNKEGSWVKNRNFFLWVPVY